MSIGYLVVVTVHALAAIFWLGGMFFLGVVGAPVLRSIEPPALRQKLFHDLGSRFRSSGWIAIGVLVVTGVVILQLRGLLHWNGVLGAPEFWNSTFGRSLAVKLVAVTTMIVVSAVHDFSLGPAAGRIEPGTPKAIAMRRKAALLARVNAVVGLVVVIAAVRLARGG